MQRIITTIIIFFIPYIVFSNDFNLQKELISEKNTEMVSVGEIESDQFDYRKPLIFKKTNEDKGFLGLLEIGESQTGDNVSETSKEPGSRLRILFGTPFTIQYVHSSGFGIAFNNIDPRIEQEGSKNSPGIMAFALSYTFLGEDFSYGLGLSKFDQEGKISGCPSNDLCYDDKRKVDDGSLIQFITTYSLLESFEISVGLNSIFFSLDKYNHPTDSNGDLGVTHYSKNTISIGTGYIF